MHYDLVIKGGKDEKIIDYLKKFEFVSIKKKKAVRKHRIKKPKPPAFSYFNAMPGWDFDFDALRKNSRKTSLKW